MHNVIVTGGSRGLGLHISRRLAEAGYCTLALARKRNPELLSALGNAERTRPGSFHFIPCDLAKVQDIPELIRNVRKDFGPIYGLINKAGVGFDGVLATMHNSQIEHVIRVNTLSPIVLSKYVVRSMMADGGGRIVNIASIISFTGYSGLSVYAA